MKRMIKGILYKQNSGEAPKVVEVEEDWQILRDLIDCRCFDITTRKFGKHICDIVCDDEGLLTEHPIPTIFESSGIYIAGSIFITGTADSNGNLTSLTPEQCRDILDLFTHKTIITKEGVMPIWTIRAVYEWEDYNA